MVEVFIGHVAFSLLNTEHDRSGMPCIRKQYAADGVLQEFARNGRTEEGSPVRANAVSVVRGKQNSIKRFESAARRTVRTSFIARIRPVVRKDLNGSFDAFTIEYASRLVCRDGIGPFTDRPCHWFGTRILFREPGVVPPTRTMVNWLIGYR